MKEEIREEIYFAEEERSKIFINYLIGPKTFCKGCLSSKIKEINENFTSKKRKLE
jgi:hypothetical protein